MYEELVLHTGQLHAMAGAGGPTSLMDATAARVPKPIKGLMADRGIKMVEQWQRNSPDVISIENVWNDIKRQVCVQGYYNLEELRTAVRCAWMQLPQDTLDNAC